MSSALLRNTLGFGRLVPSRLSADESRPWIAAAYLTDPGVRRDIAAFAQGWRGDELVEVAPRLPSYRRPVLLCSAPEDRYFLISLGRRRLETFLDARLAEIPEEKTFLALDQPDQHPRDTEGRAPIRGPACPVARTGVLAR
ncbi:alpha/beta fold hydrolase [Nocardioides sp. DS6]|uniref:Alpha/beta fold hydrolase n=1 Tax=Nocardioides eburneus TaxID=3231482 RepID=A0ABV3T315_9ACTN